MPCPRAAISGSIPTPPIPTATPNLADGAYVALSVRDDGTGIEHNVIDKVFDPFFTTKPLGQGTGLGLSTIYGFARQSGGDAHIRSVARRGTEVTIMLPASADPTAADSRTGDA